MKEAAIKEFAASKNVPTVAKELYKMLDPKEAGFSGFTGGVKDSNVLSMVDEVSECDSDRVPTSLRAAIEAAGSAFALRDYTTTNSCKKQPPPIYCR